MSVQHLKNTKKKELSHTLGQIKDGKSFLLPRCQVSNAFLTLRLKLVAEKQPVSNSKICKLSKAAVT